MRASQITDWGGTDDLPMIDGDRVFYLSDAGPEHRRNIWVYNIKDGSRAQVTHFTEHETKWPSIGPQRDRAGKRRRAVPAEPGGPRACARCISRLPGDRPHLRPYTLDPGANLMAHQPSRRMAKRVVASLRGDIWTFPARARFPASADPQRRQRRARSGVEPRRQVDRVFQRRQRRVRPVPCARPTAAATSSA